MTNALRGFFGKYQLPKATVVEMPHRGLSVFYQYELAFVKMTAWIYLCKLCVWCAHNAKIAAPTRGATSGPDKHCKTICM